MRGVAFAALALAGCMVALPQPVAPERPGYAWDTSDSDLWLARETHCLAGCTAPHAWTALWQDGSVLRIQYALGSNGTDFALHFSNGTWNRHAAAVTEVWEALYGAPPVLVTVVALDAVRLSIHDEGPVLQVIQDAVNQARDPGPPTFDCSGCPGTSYRVWGAHAFNVTLGHPTPGGAWGTLEGEMGLIGDWLDHPPAPQPLGM
ncbi:MAG: hypothetical protein ACYDBQ_09030 [Thermoplasmatota archaeon]